MKVTTIHNPHQWQQVIDRDEVEKDGRIETVYTLKGGTTVLRSQVLDFLYDEELGDINNEIKKIDS